MAEKEQFDEGSRTVDLLTEMLKSIGIISEDEVKQYQKRHSDINLRFTEECYHQLSMNAFENPSGIVSNVARWAERPV